MVIGNIQKPEDYERNLIFKKRVLTDDQLIEGLEKLEPIGELKEIEELLNEGE